MSRLFRRLYRQYPGNPDASAHSQQVQRLVGVNAALCTELLGAFIQVGFLYRTPDGYYARRV